MQERWAIHCYTVKNIDIMEWIRQYNSNTIRQQILFKIYLQMYAFNHSQQHYALRVKSATKTNLV